MNVSKGCVKALSSAQAVSATSRRAASHRSLHSASRTAQASLRLDFLAPAWQNREIYAQTLRTPSRVSSAVSPRSQSRAFSASTRNTAKAITNPRKDEEGNEMSITITPRASHRLKAIAENDKNPDLALRVAVESGGCHGFQYLMSLVNVADADAAEDTIFENEEGEGYRPKVMMDEPSLELLKGSSIDYTMELIGSQFKVTGIPGAKSSCGCGTSFDIA